MSYQAINFMLAEKLNLLANLILLENGRFAFHKAKAYQKAAATLANLDVPAQTVNDFKQFPGIGKSIEVQIGSVLSSGTSTLIEYYLQKFPGADQALKLTRVSGIGPKKAIGFYQAGIKTFEDLVSACDAGQISSGQIVRGIRMAQKSQGRLPLIEVLPTVQPIVNQLGKMPEVTHISYAGSVRRGRATVKDVDILVCATNRELVKREFLKYGEELVAGSDKVRIFTPINPTTSIQVDLLFTTPDAWGAALTYFTGSKETNVAQRTLANQLGYTLNENGFYTLSGKRVGGSTEEELYQLLGLPWCPPELREGIFTEIQDLIEAEDIWGDFHVHSNYSGDAVSSVDELAATAKQQGLRILGITDHTEKAYRFAPELVGKREREIEMARLKYGIEILSACEAGVGMDGSLDWSVSAIEQMDYVIASIHLRHFEEPVRRLITAARHPKVKIIGHPTGHKFGSRDIPNDNWDELFQVCAGEGVLLEINGPRADLPVFLIRRAKEFGCKFILSSDAHHVKQLSWLGGAIRQARRAGLTQQNLSSNLM